MSKYFYYRSVILTIFITSASLNTDANEVFNNNNDTLKQDGLVIYIGRFSKRPAILMRDTTLSGNRFDYQWHKEPDKNGSISHTNYQLPAFLIDSTLAAFCDSILVTEPNNRKIKLTSWPKKTLYNLIKKDIRLYIGYIDDKGDKNVVIQFVSQNEFKRTQHIYSSELFLVVPRKELHFAVINIGPRN